MRHLRKSLLAILGGLMVASMEASTPDSILILQSPINYLDVVVVSQVQRFQGTIPALEITRTDLRRYAALSVADVLRHCAGIQVKDYGGIGGIKTVNVRSMGSQHTGIFYDGVQLGNAQNGQIDLGQLSTDNLESVAIHQGQRSAIFQSASEFGHASTIYLRTRTPLFQGSEKHHLRLKLQGGSSGLQRFSAIWEQKLSDKVSASFHVEEMTASGRYRFRYRRLNYDGSVAYDTTATRRNGDVQAVTAEANLFGNTHNGSWQLKGYSYQSNRGIPGAIVNNVWRGGERQSDNNLFVQGKWLGNFGEAYSTRLQGKYARYGTHYINKDSTRYLADLIFRQQEAWLSTSHVYSLLTGIDLSASYDFTWNHLYSDLQEFVSPDRFSHQMSLASALDFDHFKAQASVLYALIEDHQKEINRQHRQLSPALYLRWIPNRGKRFSLHGFAKRCYRMPTFNDLYYTEMGNSQLKPERADIFDLGLQTERHFNVGTISLFADLYHNRVTDKIVAYPKGQQFRWTMLNLGKVEIDGLDLNLGYEYRIQDLTLNGNIQYTLQRAIDVTCGSDPYYRDQIPYTPRHSGSTTLSVAYADWSVNYHFTYVGERWSQQENIRYNHLQPWYTSDVNLQYQWRNYRWTAEVLNLLDQQYDVIANYPMPGRNYRLSLCAEF